MGEWEEELERHFSAFIAQLLTFVGTRYWGGEVVLDKWGDCMNVC